MCRPWCGRRAGHDPVVARLVALPASVHAKLLVAFLVIAGLLVTVSAVGLGVLGDTNRRAEELIILHRKIAAYRQLHTTPRGSSTASLRPWRCRWSRSTPA